MSNNALSPSLYISGVQWSRLYALVYLDEEYRSAKPSEDSGAEYKRYMQENLSNIKTVVKIIGSLDDDVLKVLLEVIFNAKLIPVILKKIFDLKETLESQGEVDARDVFVDLFEMVYFEELFKVSYLEEIFEICCLEDLFESLSRGRAWLEKDLSGSLNTTGNLGEIVKGLEGEEKPEHRDTVENFKKYINRVLPALKALDVSCSTSDDMGYVSYFRAFSKNVERVHSVQSFRSAMEENPFWAATNSVLYTIAIHGYSYDKYESLGADLQLKNNIFGKKNKVLYREESEEDIKEMWEYFCIIFKNMLFVNTIKLDPMPSAVDGYSFSVLSEAASDNSKAITLPSNATSC